MILGIGMIKHENYLLLLSKLEKLIISNMLSMNQQA